MTNKHLELSYSGPVKPSPELYFKSTKCQKGQSHSLHGQRRVCGCSLAGMTGSYPARGMDVCLL